MQQLQYTEKSVAKSAFPELGVHLTYTTGDVHLRRAYTTARRGQVWTHARCTTFVLALLYLYHPQTLSYSTIVYNKFVYNY